MKLALAAPYFHPHIGGVESHVMALARELLKKGHKVAVFTSRHDPALPSREDVGGIDVRRIPMRAMLFQTPMTPRLAREIQKEDWDVNPFALPAAAYGLLRGQGLEKVPCAARPHPSLRPGAALGHRPGLSPGSTKGPFLASTLRRAARIIVYTESYAATSLCHLEIPHGVRSDRAGRRQVRAAGRRGRHTGQAQARGPQGRFVRRPTHRAQGHPDASSRRRP